MAKVSKIMNTKVLTLKKEATLVDAANPLADNPIGCVVIVEGKKPIGIITEFDIVKNLVIKKINPKVKVTEIMSSPVTTIKDNAKLENVNKIIDTKHYRRYPVVKKGNLVGVVAENEVVQAINENITFHRNLQNAVLILFVIFEVFIFILYMFLICIICFF